MKLIRNILLNTSANQLRLADIYHDEKIREINFKSDEVNWNSINTESKATEFINSFHKNNSNEKNEIPLIVIPGGIDSHVHFDTPGFETHDTFEEASLSAITGGTTTIIDMPCTSLPPVTNAENLNYKLNALVGRSVVDYAFWGGIRGNDIDDFIKINEFIDELDEYGVAAYKVYVLSGMKSFQDLTYEQIEKVAKVIAQTGKPMGVHAEDKNYVLSRRDRFRSENRNSWKDYCEARSIDAEIIAVEKLIQISQRTNCKIHIVHLSSKKALDLITEAKEKGINVSTETCPHYLYFNQNHFKSSNISSFLKTAPPVKFSEDSEALWEGLKNDSIDFFITDHAGCVASEGKSEENFWKVYGGIPGVQHRVNFLFSEGFIKNKLTLEQTIRQLSTNVAEYYGIKNKGKLKIDYDADMTFINPFKENVIKGCDLKCKGKYTPFEGITFSTRIDKTILRGKTVFDRNIDLKPDFTHGQFIKIVR